MRVRRRQRRSGILMSPYPHPNPSPGGRGARIRGRRIRAPGTSLCRDLSGMPTWEKRYWQASQASGFSSEQATASTGVYAGAGAVAVAWPTVVLAIFVAGRERR